MRKPSSPKSNGDGDSRSAKASAILVLAKHIQLWSHDKLVPYAGNPRTHSESQVSQIAASMEKFGFTNPILVDSKSGVIAGHGRLLAARKLGLQKVPVIVLDHLTDAEKRAYVIADNKLAENAGWDVEKLEAELAALQAESFDLSVIGFAEQELAQLFAAEYSAEGLGDEDAIPELPVDPTSRSGDLWVLGAHRLLVGDATQPDVVRRLMAGEKADLVVLDPPYNVDYEGYTKDRLRMVGDNMTAPEYVSFLKGSFENCRTIMKPAASLYVCHASRWQREVQKALEDARFEIRCQIIYVKLTFAWGHGRYKFQHEPIFYAHLTGEKDSWYGDKTQSTVWQESKPTANRIHPTAKPVELIERPILNSSKPGDVVVDLFGGSGSTLIAGEHCGRKVRLLEIDPRYADCTVRRFEAFTGKPATLKGDGRTFEEIAKERSAKRPEKRGRKFKGQILNTSGGAH
ncbi:MAG TPA: site-specific DNA-methyltransferase [Bryobacteraceae bacterium]|nr:site-specific DNA-methyltransferase [Bryobacteraceae bacterium]